MSERDPDRPITAVVYDGVRYPITNDVAQSILAFIENFEMLTWRDFYEVPTTDGRQVILNLGPSIPIAFEVGETAD